MKHKPKVKVRFCKGVMRFYGKLIGCGNFAVDGSNYCGECNH